MTDKPRSFADGSFHWFHTPNGPQCSVFLRYKGGWHGINELGLIATHELEARGWEYLGAVQFRPMSRYLDRWPAG